MGPNFVLDKGFLATGSVAYTAGEFVVLAAPGDQVARATAANSRCIGLVTDSVETAKVTTGKAQVSVRIMGIGRALAGGAIALGDRVATDASARVVTKAQSAAGAQPTPVVGTALTAATQAGDMIDVLLTPFDVY
jgi:hypothetical protein